MTVSVDIPITTPSASNLREFWAVKAKRVKAQRLATGLMLRAGRVAHRLEEEHGKVQLHERIVVTLTRVSPRALDDDNLRGALKACRDEVAAYFGVDDGNTSRIRFEYSQAKGKPSCVRASFAVEALSSVQP